VLKEEKASICERVQIHKTYLSFWCPCPSKAVKVTAAARQKSHARQSHGHGRQLVLANKSTVEEKKNRALVEKPSLGCHVLSL
jgi:hypothetical protein